MKWGVALWAGVVLVAAGVVAVLVPSSPFYLMKLFERQGPTHEGHSVGYWVGALNDPDEEKRIHAIKSLGAIGPDAADAVPALTQVMTSGGSRGERIEAAHALANLAPASRSAVPELTQAVADKDLGVRVNAILTLMRLGKDGRPAAAALTGAIKDEANDTNLKMFQFTIREVAAVALGHVTAGTDEAVPVLTETARSAAAPNLREAAARGLGAVGPEARAAVPELEALSKDESVDVRRAASEALEVILQKQRPAPERKPGREEKTGQAPG